MNQTLSKSILEDDVYTNDDLSCFNNLQWEMTELLEYLKDCNLRKITYFKISLGILSVFVTGFGFLINAAVQNSPVVSAISFQALVSLALIIMGLLTYTVIKELYSIHASRIITLRQMNCLRQTMDSIRFRKYEGRDPESYKELRSDSTVYWLRFGQHRKLPIENEDLKNVERSMSRSPDMFMMTILLIISILLQISGVVYLAKAHAFQPWGEWGGIGIGIFLTLATGYFLSDFKRSQIELKKALGIKSNASQ